MTDVTVTNMKKVDLPVLTGTAASNSLIMDHVKVVSAYTNEIAGEYESSESMPEIITITDAQKVKKLKFLKLKNIISQI